MNARCGEFAYFGPAGLPGERAPNALPAPWPGDASSEAAAGGAGFGAGTDVGAFDLEAGALDFEEAPFDLELGPFELVDAAFEESGAVAACSLPLFSPAAEP